MRKVYLEALFAILFVVIGTIVVSGWLKPINQFWNAQNFWSIALIACWTIVAFGYFRQGWIIHHSKNAANVSLLLPAVVFIVQCILFVKGMYYDDTALMVGAVLVNTGTVFDMYQIVLHRS